MQESKYFIAYEHSVLEIKDTTVRDAFLDAAKNLGTNFCEYAKNGIKLKHWVGLMQVGDLTLEILPKTDKSGDNTKWQNVLIDMLCVAYRIDVRANNPADTAESETLLDVLILQYCRELDKLIRQGLIKKYRKHQGNTLALKGRLLFAQHIAHNLVHQERFYTEHTVYDYQHPLHQVLYAALRIIPRLGLSPAAYSATQRILLDMPEQQLLQRPMIVFDRLKRDRKTKPYDQALNLARFILQHLHPEISSGDKRSFGFLFDMNKVFELYVAETLKSKGLDVKEQKQEAFAELCSKKYYAKPDLIINNIILDTKWSKFEDNEASQHHLYQMFAYLHTFKSNRAILLHPVYEGQTEGKTEGQFKPDQKKLEVYRLKLIDESGKLCEAWANSLAADLMKGDTP